MSDWKDRSAPDPRTPCACPSRRTSGWSWGPASAYYGMDAYDTALREGDASPDAKRLGWTGAEPGKGSLDDVPPQDR